MADETWERWGEWVKSTVHDNKENISKIEESIQDIYGLITDIRIELASQRVKTGIISLVCSSVPVLLLIAVNLYFKKGN